MYDYQIGFGILLIWVFTGNGGGISFSISTTYSLKSVADEMATPRRRNPARRDNSAENSPSKCLHCLHILSLIVIILEL